MRKLSPGLGGDPLDLGVDVRVLDLDLLRLGDLLEDEVLHERDGRALQDVLPQDGHPGLDLLIVHPGRAHFHDAPLQGPRRLADEQVAGQVPLHLLGHLLEDLLPGELPLLEFQVPLEAVGDQLLELALVLDAVPFEQVRRQLGQADDLDVLDGEPTLDGLALERLVGDRLGRA